MVNSCMVCKVSANKADRSVIFHRFPKDRKQREKWMKILNIDVPRETTCICSQHFEKSQYKEGALGPSKYLRMEAVPSLHIPQKNKGNMDAYDIIEETSNDVQHEKVQTKDVPCATAVEIKHLALKRPHQSLVEEAGSSIVNNVPLPNVFRLGDVDIDNVTKSPVESKMCLEVAIETIHELREKIGNYQTTVKRLENKVSNLQSLLANLKDDNRLLLQKH